jgi:hypothetical protein
MIKRGEVYFLKVFFLLFGKCHLEERMMGIFMLEKQKKPTKTLDCKRALVLVWLP